MEQPVAPFPPDRTETRRWIGRIIIAVLLGEALWGLIVSVMNNLVVPWLGDFMGQSSGLPTSFTQRPYNYPDLFVSILEVCFAGLVAAILNYFFQRPQARRMMSVKSPVPAASPGPVRIFPEAAKTPAPAKVAVAETPQNQAGFSHTASPIALAPEIKAESVIPPTPIAVAPAEPLPKVPAAEPKAGALAPPASAVAAAPPKPLPPSPKSVPAKPKKPKPVYYNIVGEPMPSDDD